MHRGEGSDKELGVKHALGVGNISHPAAEQTGTHTWGTI